MTVDRKIMKILGIDFGTKNIGLAWTDTTLGMVLPFGVVKNTTELIKIIREERVDLIVFGFPITLTGQENKNTERIKKAAFEIQKQTGLEVQFFDERFTSQAADAVGPGVSRDEKSAMIILEGYLESLKH